MKFPISHLTGKMNITTAASSISPFSKSTDEMNSFENKNLTTTGNRGVESVVALVYVWQNNPALFIAIICLYFLLIIVGIILNGLVCYVMIKSKRCLKNISCFFITHMAAVDLFYRVVLTPVVVYMSLPSEEVQSPIPCKISAFVSSSCAAAIFGSLVVIAIDRYLNIVQPLSSLKRRKRPFLIGVLVWIYAIGSSVMFLYTVHNVPLSDLPEAKDIERDGKPTSCDIIPGPIGGLSVTISAVMIFVIPLVILIITYSAIFVSLRRRCQNGLVHSVAAKSKAKAARMLILVVIGFVLSFGPSIVIQTLRSYDVFDDTNSESLVVVLIIADILQFCSSLANPAIYAFYSDDFKKDMFKTCLWINVKRVSFLDQQVASAEKDNSTKPATTATSLDTITTTF